MLFKRGIIEKTAWIIITLSLTVAVFLAFQRIQLERTYNKVEVAVNYTEFYSLKEANEYKTEDLSNLLKGNGVSAMLVKELSLGELRRNGEIGFYQGKEIARESFANQVSSTIPLAENLMLITIHNKSMEEQIVKHLEIKIPGSIYYPSEISVVTIPINIPNSDSEKNEIIEQLSGVGLGFPQEKMKELSANGFAIIPQVRDWYSVTEEALGFMIEELKEIPGLYTILFNDKRVPGGFGYLNLLSQKIEAEFPEKLSIGTIEFFDQSGLQNLSLELEKRVIRMHTISKEEMINYSPARAVERYLLAAKERNVRLLFVRLFDMENPTLALEKNVEFLDRLHNGLLDNGFAIGRIGQFSSPAYSRIFVFLLGLGTIAAMLIIGSKLNLQKTSLIISGGAVLIWLALVMREPLLARKIMALGTVIIFPTLAFVICIEKHKRSLFRATISLLKLSLISFMGALIMIGLLADKLFMLKIDQFTGVKLAHVIPLLLIPLAVMWKDNFRAKQIKELANSCVKYKEVIFAFIFGVVLLVYVLRTGNDAQSLVFGIENKIRSALDLLLGTRPRTKEFLIGYPLTVFLLYQGFARKYWWMLIFAAIGQISLVNTYAHIHTPILVSLHRSFNGLLLGIVLGLLLILVFKFMVKFAAKMGFDIKDGDNE